MTKFILGFSVIFYAMCGIYITVAPFFDFPVNEPKPSSIVVTTSMILYLMWAKNDN